MCLCYEVSACPLLLNSNKVYFASSLIAKPKCYGPLPIFLCNIAGFLKGCCNLFVALTIVTNTFIRFMFVCIWKRMRQMDDNLIVGITTIQAIVLSLFFTAASWLKLHGQGMGHQVSLFFVNKVCLW